ncbi:MAG: tRNA (adenosine(37)-N6)-threonylcarbamoyltransferase complex transferase subunit TsaD [Candidatus Kerfeldbacteria bacterium]|nr:tRNA (adenosine(37)-N6)-threonylcarbamoyltransferase complex transferase subunit TsaD [Candidatus Kerfeldbacteria bacterium]
MKVLGIETSCDDTAIGIVNYGRGRFVIQAQVEASQVLIHRKYGGVVPEVAAREHAVTIIPTLKAALRRARVVWNDLDVIAVTAGPGLMTALSVGVETARTLSYALKKPLVRVNHIEGHIISNWIHPAAAKIRFPAVALIVSGGHTELILVKSIGQYKLLGRTLDDAVGEAFDKVAKLLGLTYPGGPSVAKRALRGNPAAFSFPRALMGRGNLDFSYAGLKTAVLYEWRKHRRRSVKLVNDLCASFQAAATDQLVAKSRWAMDKTRAKTLLLAGGVAANELLRRRLSSIVNREFPGARYFQAPLSLCMDNGVMIAMAGAFHATHRRFTPWKKIRADPNWELV